MATHQVLDLTAIAVVLEMPKNSRRPVAKYSFDPGDQARACISASCKLQCITQARAESFVFSLFGRISSCPLPGQTSGKLLGSSRASRSSPRPGAELVQSRDDPGALLPKNPKAI